MSTAAAHPAASAADAVDAFNIQLAHAKLGALKLLQDLMASLTDPDASVGAALREIRLAATAILRAKPMKNASLLPATPPSSPSGRGNVLAQRGRGEGVPHTTCGEAAANQKPSGPRPLPQRRPTPHAPTPYLSATSLNPTYRAARRDVRNLIRDGCPEIIRLFLAQRQPTRAAGPAP